MLAYQHGVSKYVLSSATPSIYTPTQETSCCLFIEFAMQPLESSSGTTGAPTTSSKHYFKGRLKLCWVLSGGTRLFWCASLTKKAQKQPLWNQTPVHHPPVTPQRFSLHSRELCKRFLSHQNSLVNTTRSFWCLFCKTHVCCRSPYVKAIHRRPDSGDHWKNRCHRLETTVNRSKH